MWKEIFISHTFIIKLLNLSHNTISGQVKETTETCLLEMLEKLMLLPRATRNVQFHTPPVSPQQTLMKSLLNKGNGIFICLKYRPEKCQVGENLLLHGYFKCI